MPQRNTMETALYSSTSFGSPVTLVMAPEVDAACSVPISTIASASCVIAAPHSLTAQSADHTVNGDRHCASRKIGGNPIAVSCSSIREQSENEEDEERIEAELDEMARYIGPVAKSLFTPVVAPLVDANSFADALGVAPLYKQKESQRWSSALHIYRQMSATDQNSGQQLLSSQVSVDEDLVQAASLNGNAVHVDESDTPASASARPITIPLSSRQQNGPPTALLSSSVARNVLTPATTSASFTGFMTPPALLPSRVPSQMAAASCVVSPPRRKSSSVSPGESSLNSLELEAIAAVHELQFAVKDIYVSEMLPRTSDLIFLNVSTLEGQAYCVELTMKGWRVTSLRHDCMNGDVNNLDLHVQYFETIYALMDGISPAYRRRFTDALMAKLAAIEASRLDEAEPAAEKSDCANGRNENGNEDRFEQEERQTFT